MCIKNDLQKKKNNILCETKNTLKIQHFSQVEVKFFLSQFFLPYITYAMITGTELELINKFWPGSPKWNTSLWLCTGCPDQIGGNIHNTCRKCKDSFRIVRNWPTKYVLS